MIRSLVGALLFLGVLACESPPEDRCTASAGEGSVDFECPPADDDWQERALEEAEEGMEQRSPDGRP